MLRAANSSLLKRRPQFSKCSSRTFLRLVPLKVLTKTLRTSPCRCKHQSCIKQKSPVASPPSWRKNVVWMLCFLVFFDLARIVFIALLLVVLLLLVIGLILAIL